MKVHIKELKPNQPIALVYRKKKYIPMPDSLWSNEPIHYADPISIIKSISNGQWSVLCKVRRDDRKLTIITDAVTVQNL